jgi:hypothetical protein
MWLLMDLDSENSLLAIPLRRLTMLACRDLLEKLIVSQLSRNSSHFMEPEGSLQRSQVPATCSYPDPEQSSPCPHPTAWRFILILSSHLRLGLPGGSLATVESDSYLYWLLTFHVPYFMPLFRTMGVLVPAVFLEWWIWDWLYFNTASFDIWGKSHIPNIGIRCRLQLQAPATLTFAKDRSNTVASSVATWQLPAAALSLFTEAYSLTVTRLIKQLITKQVINYI